MANRTVKNFHINSKDTRSTFVKFMGLYLNWKILCMLYASWNNQFN